MKNKIITIIFGIALVLFILTFSIGLPIYCRFFYYIQIKTLHLEELSGFSYNVIKQAYDEVLDFCTLPWVNNFSAGELKFSSEGAAHFADCKVLFNLNLYVLIFSSLIMIVIYILKKCKVIDLVKFKGHGIKFYASLIALLLPIIIITLVFIVGFDKAFEVFHAIFFPGKSNWIFDSATDEIILVMPSNFFMNCGIIVACGLIVISLTLIVIDVITKHRNKKKIISNR